MAMLRAGGFPLSKPCLVSSGMLWPGDVPVPEICGITVITSTGGGDIILLDPESPYEHHWTYTLDGRTFLACILPECRIGEIGGLRSQQNKSTLDLVLKEGASGVIEGEGRALLTGFFSPYYLMRGTGTEAEDFVKARVGGLFEGAELTSWNPSAINWDRTELAFDFTVKLPDTKTGERVYLKLPRPFEAALSGIDRLRLERSTIPDAFRVRPCVLELSCTFGGFQGWSVVSLPQSGEGRNDIGSSVVAVESAPDGDMTCRKTLAIDGDFVLPGDYPDLRSLLRTFGEDRIVLEKK